MADCKFYFRGRCSKGSSCPYRHNPATTSRLATATPDTYPWPGRDNFSKTTQLPRDFRPLIPCKYHIRGNCFRGEDCPYAHSENTGTTCGRQEAEEFTDNDKRVEHDDFCRLFSGAIVQFQDGAQISKITMLGDFSAVRIDHLPPESSRESVAAILHGLGFNIGLDCVRVLKPVVESRASAVVNVGNPAFAQDFCTKLKLNKQSSPQSSCLEAFETPSPTPLESAGRRMSHKKVNVSWHKPYRQVWLNFGNREVAERVRNKFNEGIYKIRDQTVTASPPQNHASPQHGHNPRPWTVVLKGAPLKTCQIDVHNSIRTAYDKPRHIELAKARAPEVETPDVFVESLLTNIGPVEFKIIPNSQSKRVKAVGHFEKEEDAREAEQTLHDKPQWFLNQGKLTLKLVSSAKFKVLTTIYEVLRPQIQMHKKSCEKQHVLLMDYRNTDVLQRFATLKIEGEEKKDVANAANTLEGILAGQPVNDGDTPLWSITSQNIQRIEREHDVVLVRHKMKRELKFYGPMDKHETVRRAIADLVRTGSSTPREIPLNASTFSWACTGGLKQINSALGDNLASLDVTSDPKKIFITGTEKTYKTALAMVQKSKEIGPAVLSNEDQDCPLCMDEAEEPILTSCNHHYCLGCFEHQCLSADSQDGEPCVCCLGDSGKCGKIFSLQEMQDHLSSTIFEQVLGNSLTSYVRRQPQRIRYCPTPDCDYVYRPSADAHTHTCLKCLEMVCTACHEQHGLMTCAAYKDLRSGGYEEFAKFKRENGIKDCPKCKTPMEKTEGCNHMTCGGCNIHICWVCMKTFPQSGECYAHMTTIHGGIGLNHLEYI